jgi:hypothetical protein
LYFVYHLTFIRQKQISYGKIQILLKEKFEDIKGVIRSLTSQDRKNNGQKKKDKWTSNDLQNNTKKTKNEQYELPYKAGLNSGGRVVIPLTGLTQTHCMPSQVRSFIYVICIYVLVSNTIPFQLMFVSFNSNTTQYNSRVNECS